MPISSPSQGLDKYRPCTRLPPYLFNPCGWESQQCMQQQRRGAHGFLCGVRISGSNPPPPQFCVIRPIPVLAAYTSSTKMLQCYTDGASLPACLRWSEPYLLTLITLVFFVFADQSPHHSSAPRWCHPPPPHSASTPKEVIPIRTSKRRRRLLNTRSYK